jgi:hypothetical protein
MQTGFFDLSQSTIDDYFIKYFELNTTRLYQ